MDNKRVGKYLVTYNNGTTQQIEGFINLFSTANTSIIHSNKAIHLNASSVLSIVPISDETGKEV